MLVLSRRIGETVIIGENVKVTVLSIKGMNHVRLGIAAPEEVPVHRAEVARRHRLGSPKADYSIDE